MQQLPDSLDILTGQATQAALARRLRKQKELLVQRTIFRFRNLKTITIITSGTVSSSRSDFRFSVDNDSIYDDMEDNSVSYLRLLRSKKIRLAGPWLAPEIKFVKVVDMPLHGRTSLTARSAPRTGELEDPRCSLLFPAIGFLPQVPWSTMSLVSKDQKSSVGHGS